MHAPLICAFMVAFTATPLACETAQIGPIQYDSLKGVALILGEIDLNTSNQFQQMLVENPNLHLLVLDSLGGTVVPALDIAAAVNALGITTYVPEGATCASACTFIFFAGKERLAAGNLGVHQMSLPSGGDGNISEVQLLVSRELDAFEKYGVSREVSRKMLTTSSEDIYFFSEQEKEQLGINRSDGDSAPAILPESARISAKFTDYPTEDYMSASDGIELPDFNGRDAHARSFRTRIREGLKTGPNIAGHYALIEIGCGTSCRFAYLADERTGQVFDFPYGGEEYYEMNLLYNLDSTLVKATWADLNTEECVQQDLAWNGRTFDVIGEIRFPRVGFCNG